MQAMQALCGRVVRIGELAASEVCLGILARMQQCTASDPPAVGGC